MSLMSFAIFPRSVLTIAAVYFAASLAHFAHNAEYIAFYPGMPGWLTPEKVYLAWVGVSVPGVLAFVFARFSMAVPALLCLAAYGAFGLDGLAHYTLGLCADHTFVSNLTIWFEAVSGLALLLVSAVLCVRRRA